MPHASLKLKPGVDQNETPALNEAGISQSNLIRFIPDRNGVGLVQKLGGWTKYYNGATPIPAIVRAMLAWEDTNANSHLAFGTQNSGSTSHATLGVVNSVSSPYLDITPTTFSDSVTPAASTTAGDAFVKITDTSSGEITKYDSVYIATHISVGGIILFGLYACDPDLYSNPTEYTVLSRDVLGNPLPAVSTSTTTAVAIFTTVAGSISVNVNLPNHGYVVGSTYPALVLTTVGGINIYGNYIVESVTDADNFVIYASTSAVTSDTKSINGGNAYFIYNFGVGSTTYLGYGFGPYGSYDYGLGEPVTPSSNGTPIKALNWTLDNWGQILLACPTYPSVPQFQPIYQWDPTSNANRATIISNAPAVNEGIFVAMPQRQVIAYGSTETGIQDPLLVRWCDVNNFNVWTPTVVNQAGSYRIPKGSKIVGGIQGPQQGLLWTDIGCWAMQYIGPPYVYSFNEIGAGCGLIAKKAAATLNGVVYWMGPSQFFSLSSQGVQPVFCPVWDVIFQDLDTDNLDKIRAAVNSRFGEISWFYPTKSNGGEINAYVKYNVALGTWDFGTLARSSWIDQSVLGPPIGADPNTLQIYQHETSTDADGSPLLASFRTGYFALTEADVKSFIDEVWPDMKWGYYDGNQNATVNITFYVADFAGQTPQVFGPYPVTQNTTWFNPRFRGRLVAIELSNPNDVSGIGTFWRIGNIRYRLQQDGRY